jgi:nucleoside-diphosphate-sugar epimerase
VQRTCAITGAGGYVGSCVARQLASAGWEIRALSHSERNGRQSQFTEARFELAREPSPQLFEGVDALVHAAYDFRPTRWADIRQVNVEGSRRLFSAARRAAVGRIVLVSTVAAFPGARSMYGRAKLEIERAAIEVGAAIVRPGLVWGPRGASILGALQRAVERLPLVPLLVPPALELSAVHEDDLAVLVERLLQSWPAGSGKLLVAASEATLTFGDLLRRLAASAGRRPRLVRFPWQAAWLGLRALEALGAATPFRSDSLLSLATADGDPFSRATDRPERYGVQFRPYQPA